MRTFLNAKGHGSDLRGALSGKQFDLTQSGCLEIVLADHSQG